MATCAPFSGADMLEAVLKVALRMIVSAVLLLRYIVYCCFLFLCIRGQKGIIPYRTAAAWRTKKPWKLKRPLFLSALSKVW
jgi:hypothetical protein